MSWLCPCVSCILPPLVSPASPPVGVELLALSCLIGTLSTPALNPLVSPAACELLVLHPLRPYLHIAEYLEKRILFNLVFLNPRITTFPAPQPLLEPPSASQLPTAFITGPSTSSSHFSLFNKPSLIHHILGSGSANMTFF